MQGKGDGLLSTGKGKARQKGKGKARQKSSERRQKNLENNFKRLRAALREGSSIDDAWKTSSPAKARRGRKKRTKERLVADVVLTAPFPADEGNPGARDTDSDTA